MAEKNEKKGLFRITNIVRDNNKFSEAQKDLTISDIRKKAINDVETKEYAKEHKGEHTMYWVLFVIFVIAGVFIAKSGVEYLFGKYISNGYIVTIISVIIFSFIYFAEYLNISKSWIRFNKQLNIGALRLVMMVLISLFNISFVFLGIYQMTSKEINESTTSISNVTSTDSTSIVTEYDTQIARYDDLINVMKSNPQGWSNGKRTTLTDEQLVKIDEYQTTINELKQEKQNRLDNLLISKSTQINESTTEKKDWFWVKLIFSLVLEILIILFIIAISNYKLGIWKEFKMLETDLIESVRKMILRNSITLEQAEKMFAQNNMILPLDLRELIEQQQQSKDVAPEKSEVKFEKSTNQRPSNLTDIFDMSDEGEEWELLKN